MTTPHLQSIDMAIHKRFQMPYNEQHAIQFRLETFNTFNHPSWGALSGHILAGAQFAGGIHGRASGLWSDHLDSHPNAPGSSGLEVSVLKLQIVTAV